MERTGKHNSYITKLPVESKDKAALIRKENTATISVFFSVHRFSWHNVKKVFAVVMDVIHCLLEKKKTLEKL